MKFALSKPGLFFTATDTDIGKTVVACGIAAILRGRGMRIGVCKPYATGCRRDREGLVSEDAEALAHFANCMLPLATINPVRYHAPLAPAVAAERERGQGDPPDIAESLKQLDAISDIILIEGIGGVLVPLTDDRVVLDLMVDIGYPVIVITNARLGTLNQTALTCRAVRDAGLPLAGLIINRFHVDTPDLAEATNPRRLAQQNDTTILATVPDVPGVAPQKAKMPDDIIAALNVIDWSRIAARPA